MRTEQNIERDRILRNIACEVNEHEAVMMHDASGAGRTPPPLVEQECCRICGYDAHYAGPKSAGPKSNVCAWCGA